jgi:2,4-dienoyl-CoA reductase (NADPH2)
METTIKTFDTMSLGPLELKNRLLMAPVKTAFGGTDAKVTNRLIEYYRRRARGGVAAIIVESMFVDAVGKEHPKQLGIGNDDVIDGLR